MNEIVSTVNTVATVLSAEVTIETLLFGSPPSIFISDIGEFSVFVL